MGIWRLQKELFDGNLNAVASYKVTFIVIFNTLLRLNHRNGFKDKKLLVKIP